MSSNERYLKIGISADATQAKAEFAELQGQVAGVAGAQEELAASSTQATEASEAQAEATARVSASLETAMAAMGEYSAVAVQGGSAATAAFEETMTAVAQLEIAVEGAKAVGSPVSASTVAVLEAYNKVLEETAVAQEIAGNASNKLKTNFGAMRAEGALASEAVGPLGRALVALGGSGDGAAASLSRFILPLAAALGAAVALDKGLSALKDRGVDVSSASDAMSGALDAVAIALGGTSKATQDAVAAFMAAQKGIEDLDKASVSYKSGVDLIIGSGLDLKATLIGTTDAANASATSFEILGEGVISTGRTVGDTIDQISALNRDINIVRVSSPELAKQMATDFATIEKDIAAGVAGASTRLDELGTKALDAAKSTEELTKQIEGTYGKDGPKAFAQFSAGVQDTLDKFAALRKVMTEQQAVAALKGQFDAAAAGAVAFAGVLATMKDRDLPGASARAKELDDAFGSMAASVNRAKQAIRDEAVEEDHVRSVIDAHSKSIADRNIAITALLPIIDSQIAKLDSQRDSTGKLTDVQQILFTQYSQWRGEIGKTNPELDKQNKAITDFTVNIGNIGKRFDDLTKTYEKQRAETILNADTAIAQAQRQRQAVSAEVDGQIADLDAAHRNGEVSNADYFAKVAELQTKEVDARRDAESKTAVIQQTEESKLADLQTAYGEATAEIKRILGEQGQTIESARKIHEALAKQAKVTSDALVTEANRHADLAASMAGVFGSVDKALKDLSKSGGGLDLTKGALGDVEAAVDRVSGKLIIMAGHLREIDVSGTQNPPVGAKGAEGTPGSEGQ